MASSLAVIKKRLDRHRARLQRFREGESELFSKLQARLGLLGDAIGTVSRPGLQSEMNLSQRKVHSIQLSALVVDYLLRIGEPEVGISFAEEAGVQSYVEIAIFQELQKVLDSLRARSCSKALAWCRKRRLTKQHGSTTLLTFQLKLQEFIEKVRSGDLIEALDFVKKEIVPLKVQGTMQEELQRAMGILGFGGKTGLIRYKHFFDDERWNVLQELFRDEFLNFYYITSQSHLEIIAKAGMSALNTPFCGVSKEYNVDCPTCSKEIRDMTVALPLANHLQSVLMCRISGEKMTDNNYPVALPSGYVYSIEAVTKMANENHGQIRCPRTQKVCNVSEIRKVFTT